MEQPSIPICEERISRHPPFVLAFVAIIVVALTTGCVGRSSPQATGTQPASPSIPSEAPSPSRAIVRPSMARRNGEWVVISVSSLDPDARPMSRGKPANLFVTEPGGSARLLAGAKGDSTLETCPAFSPDGSMLAYGQTGPYGQTRPVEKTLVVSGFSSAGELVGPTTRIPVPAARSFVRPCPVWAPDGRRLATIAPGLGVMIVDLDGGTHLVRLDAYGLHEEDPTLRWSPDGSHLALLVSTSQSHETLRLIPAGGGAAHLLPGIDPDTNSIAWTADGGSIVVAGGGCCPGGRPFVEVVDVTTGDTHEIPLPGTWDTLGYEALIGSEGDRFLLMRGWDRPLSWIDLQGNVTPVKLEHPMATVPTLSPDGQQLLYVTYGQPFGAQTLVAVPLDGDSPTRYSPSTDAYGDNYATYTWQPR